MTRSEACSEPAADIRPRAWLRRAAAAASLALACVATAQTPSAAPQASPPDKSMQPAAPSRLAARSVMLDVAACGSRLVAVGERGRVLLSDDRARTWRQAKAVPVSVTLTAVQCVNATRGWAVGHAGVVLRSDDAGETWQLQLDGSAAAQLALKAAEARPEDGAALGAAKQLVAEGPDKPLLALHFSNPNQGLVVGAYGLIFSTDDAGATWRARLMDAENPKGLHLNAVRSIGSKTYVAGEKGLLLRSDGGPRFVALKSPYEGSWFTVDAAPGGGVVLAGLRGNAFVSDEGAASWRKLELPSRATVLASRRLGNGPLLLIAQDGTACVLGTDGKIVRLTLPATAPLTAGVQTGDGALAVTTLRGPMRVEVSSSALAKVTEVR